jgi:hypothetical protein
MAEGDTVERKDAADAALDLGSYDILGQQPGNAAR